MQRSIRKPQGASPAERGLGKAARGGWSCLKLLFFFKLPPLGYESGESFNSGWWT